MDVVFGDVTEHIGQAPVHFFSERCLLKAVEDEFCQLVGKPGFVLCCIPLRGSKV